MLNNPMILWCDSNFLCFLSLVRWHPCRAVGRRCCGAAVLLYRCAAVPLCRWCGYMRVYLRDSGRGFFRGGSACLLGFLWSFLLLFLKGWGWFWYCFGFGDFWGPCGGPLLMGLQSYLLSIIPLKRRDILGWWVSKRVE